MKLHAAAALLAGLALAGCGMVTHDSGSRKAKPNMDMKTAAQTADSILDKTLDAVKPRVQWAHGEPTDSLCDSSGAPADTSSVTRRRTVTTIISDERRGAFLGLVERAWRNRGYKITGNNPNKRMPALFASTSENFRMSLIFKAKGQAFLEVVSPCAAQSEILEPATKPNGPDYAPGEIPRPNVHSNFWSALSPVGSERESESDS